MKKGGTQKTKAIRKPNKMRRVLTGISKKTGKRQGGGPAVKKIRVSSLTRQLRKSVEKSTKKKKRRTKRPRQSIFLPPTRIIRKNPRGSNNFKVPMTQTTPKRKGQVYERSTPMMPLSGFKSPQVRRKEKEMRMSQTIPRKDPVPVDRKLNFDEEETKKGEVVKKASTKKMMKEKKKTVTFQEPENKMPQKEEENGGKITLELINDEESLEDITESEDFVMDNSDFIPQRTLPEMYNHLDSVYQQARHFANTKMVMKEFESLEPSKSITVGDLVGFFKKSCPELFTDYNELKM